MSWQILIAFSMVTHSLSIIMQRVLLRDRRQVTVAYAIWFQLAVAAVMFVLAILTGQFHFSFHAAPATNLWLLIALYGTANIFMYKSLSQAEASLFAIIFSSRAFFTVLEPILKIAFEPKDAISERGASRRMKNIPDILSPRRSPAARNWGLQSRNGFLG